MRKVPVILFGQNYWDRTINFDALVEEGAISQCGRELLQYAESADEAWVIILENYTNGNNHKGN
ncbi:hypothetical protein [Methyloglobulus sp.]|uniref:hypothetical protein n=1 Tax=Methyloglobulus sp. TaxID=2518622 RepID=UPI003988B380